METVKDLLRARQDREEPAVTSNTRVSDYSYEGLVTDVWKAANLFSHYGVHRGGTVTVAGRTDSNRPVWNSGVVHPLVAILGAMTVGASVSFPKRSRTESDVLVAPVESIDSYSTGPGCTVLTYGEPPESADVTGFESALWSENAVEPPEPLSSGTTAMSLDGRQLSHASLIDAAKRLRTAYDLDESATLRSLPHPVEVGSVAAGIIAPILVGATIAIDPPGQDVVGDDNVMTIGTRDTGGTPTISVSTVDVGNQGD